MYMDFFKEKVIYTNLRKWMRLLSLEFGGIYSYIYVYLVSYLIRNGYITFFLMKVVEIKTLLFTQFHDLLN